MLISCCAIELEYILTWRQTGSHFAPGKIAWDLPSLPDLSQSKDRTSVPYQEVTTAPEQICRPAAKLIVTRCWTCDAMLPSLPILISSQIFLHKKTATGILTPSRATLPSRKKQKGRKPSQRRNLPMVEDMSPPTRDGGT